jgi:glycine cleavage system H protein
MTEEYLSVTVDKFMIKVKKGLGYTRDDVWVQQTGESYRVGITDLAQRMGGDIVFVDFPGKSGFMMGDPLASYETIKAVLDVKAPFDCDMTSFNDDLGERPELINEDPYGEGWVAEVKPVAPDQMKRLLGDQEYFNYMKAKAEAEVRKLKGAEDD